MQNSMVMFHFVLDTKYPFWTNFIPKKQELKLKFGTQTNLSMQKSMIDAHFFCFWPQITFLGKFGPQNSNFFV